MASDFKKRLLISISIIICSAVAAGVGLYYLAGATTATVSGILTDRQLITSRTGALGTLATLRQQAPQVAAYQAAMDKLVPTQDGLINFTQWINTIAAQRQVVASVAFGGGSNVVQGILAQNFGTAPFSLTVTGDPNSIVAFLTDVESNVPGFLVDLNSFTLTKNSNNYELQSQGVVFFRQ
jgi:Tfp pilus assembly protein PilO